MSNTQHAFPSLKAFAESKTEGVTKLVSFRVKPSLVEFEDGFNLREETADTKEHIDRLYKAMKAGAVMPAIDVSVVEGKIICRDGHCRTRAAQMLEKEVPEFTLEARQLRGSEADNVLHMLGTGSGGKPLSPLEQGKGYLRLIAYGLTTTQIAEKLGVSRVTIDNGVTLAEAPVAVQKMIIAGEVSSTTAREALKNGKEGVAALKKAVEEKREAPAPEKGNKPAKKKVTAKNLKGTAAAKKAPKKKAESPEVAKPESFAATHPEPQGEADTSKITVTLDRAHAESAAKYLREFGGDAEDLNAVAAAFETALM